MLAGITVAERPLRFQPIMRFCPFDAYMRALDFPAFLGGPQWRAQMEKSACARRVHKRLEKGRLNEAGPANSHK